jgi:hypothetical protein
VDAGDVLLLGDALETSGVPGVVATHPGADHGRAADGDAGGGRTDALAQRGARGKSTDGGHRVDRVKIECRRRRSQCRRRIEIGN